MFMFPLKKLARKELKSYSYIYKNGTWSVNNVRCVDINKGIYKRAYIIKANEAVVVYIYMQSYAHIYQSMNVEI